MPSVQVKDFPQDLYDQLKEFAEANHRSMAQQLVVAAEQMLSHAAEVDYATGRLGNLQEAAEEERLARVAKRRALFARIKASAARARDGGLWPPDDLDAVELVRNGREERSRQQSALLGASHGEGAQA